MENEITTYIVNGFMDAGKTTYIQDNIFRDFFHKRGKTLILVFEDGEEEYDCEKLLDFRTEVEIYEGGESVPAFCIRQIEKHKPDRIYVEANIMMDGLLEQLPKIMKKQYTTTLIDGKTVSIYYNNLRQQMQDMIRESDMVIFERNEKKEELSEYNTPFHIINSKCVYLWESPMGYSEQAFSIYLPYDLNQDELVIDDETYPIWYLDASKNPEHYEGKLVNLHIQAELKDNLSEGHFIAGRQIMTCCLADMQFLGFECLNLKNQKISDHCWLQVTARCSLKEDKYNVRRLFLEPLEMKPAAALPGPYAFV